MSPRQGERVKIPLLSNNVGKESVKYAGPLQGHDNQNIISLIQMVYVYSYLLSYPKIATLGESQPPRDKLQPLNINLNRKAKTLLS